MLYVKCFLIIERKKYKLCFFFIPSHCSDWSETLFSFIYYFVTCMYLFINLVLLDLTSITFLFQFLKLLL